jgi:hypothetical protein
MKRISMWIAVAAVAALLGVACGSKESAADESTRSPNAGGDGGAMYGGDVYGEEGC